MVEPEDPARERYVAGSTGEEELATSSRISLGRYGCATRTLDAFEVLRDIDGRCTTVCSSGE